MENNFYTVFFASEKNKYSRSFQMSKANFLVVVLFVIMILGLTIIGGLRLLNKDKLTNQLSDIKKKNILLQNLLIDLEFHGILDSTKGYEQFIVDYYGSNNLELPNK
ncbi:uncharacterized protein METZ01_LOCUS452286, partial [marine metagenome]